MSKAQKSRERSGGNGLNRCAQCFSNSETQTEATVVHKRRRISIGMSCVRGGAAHMGPGKQRRNMKGWLRTFNRFADSKKQEALSRLVNGLSSSLARHLLETIEPRFQVDFMTRLPREISLKILSYLRPADLHSALLVSRRWNAIASDDLLWRAKCSELDIVEDNTSAPAGLLSKTASVSSCESNAVLLDCRSGSRTDTLDKVIENQLSVRLRPLTHTYNINQNSNFDESNDGYADADADADADTDETGDCQRGVADGRWKKLFARQMRVERNWRSSATRITEVRGHDDHVITCLELFGGLVVSGSDDGTLKVWRIDDGSLVRTLTGHSGGVWASQMLADELLVSGSTDRTVRVWNVRTGACVHVLTGHNSTVRCLHLHAASRRVASGSRDATVRLWNIEAGRCERTLLGHIASVRCVQFDGSIVCSGAYDFTVRVWDAATGACLHTLLGHTNRVYSLLLAPPPDPDSPNGGGPRLLVSGSLDATVRVWHVGTGECLHTLLGHQSLTSAIELLDASTLRLLAQQAANAFRPLPLPACPVSLSASHPPFSLGLASPPHLGPDAIAAPACATTATPNAAAGTSRWLVTGNADSTMRVWDLQDGHCVHVLAGAHKHQSALTAMQLVRGMLVSASDDGTVKLWNVRTGEFVRDLVRLPSAGAGGVVWRVRSSNSRLVCAVGSRNASEPTKLIILHFDSPDIDIDIDSEASQSIPECSALATLLPASDLPVNGSTISSSRAIYREKPNPNTPAHSLTAPTPSCAIGCWTRTESNCSTSSVSANASGGALSSLIVAVASDSSSDVQQDQDQDQDQEHENERGLTDGDQP